MPSSPPNITLFQSRQCNVCKQPKIVTDGWLDVADTLGKTGFFYGDMLNPRGVPQILADLVRRYTTVIGYRANEAVVPLGSGTFLARIDGQYGILTTGHVVGAVRNGKNIFVLPAQHQEKVFWIEIEAADMHACGERNNRVIGSDIGWIPLSVEEARKMETLGVVFHNRARNVDDFAGEICQIYIIFGFIADVSNPENNTVVAHGMLIGKTAEQPSDQDGWDYAEYAITSDDEWIPRTHGGVSGSAVWRIDLPMDGKGKKAVRLEAVIYAEGPEGGRKFIAHGKQSIRMFLKER